MIRPLLVAALLIVLPGLALAHGSEHADPVQSAAVAILLPGIARGIILGVGLSLAGILLFDIWIWKPVASGLPTHGILAFFRLDPPGPDRPALRIAVTGQALLIPMALGLFGHAHHQAEGLAMVASRWLHMTAAAVWTGGLVGFVLTVLPALRGVPERQRLPLVKSAVLRFSPVALCAVMTLWVTGVYAAANRMPGGADLLASPFGRTLTFKTLLALSLLILGAYSLIRGGEGRFRQAVTGEAALALAIILTAGVLGRLPAGADPSDGNPAAPVVAEMPASVPPAGQSAWISVALPEPVYASSGIRVVNTAGVRVHPGYGGPAANDPSQWRLRLPGLVPGSYLLQWDLLLARDGRRYRGSVPFEVRAVEAAWADHGTAHGMAPGAPMHVPRTQANPSEAPPSPASPPAGSHFLARQTLMWAGLVIEVLLVAAAVVTGPRQGLARRMAVMALTIHVMEGVLFWHVLQQAPFDGAAISGRTVSPFAGLYGYGWVLKLLVLSAMAAWAGQPRPAVVSAVLLLSRAFLAPLPLGQWWLSAILTGVLLLAWVAAAWVWITPAGIRNVRRGLRQAVL